MKKGNSIILIIFIILGCFLCFKIYNTSHQDNLLKHELNKISRSDLSFQNVDMKIKTKNNAAIVEEEIKTYFNILSNHLHELRGYLKENRLITILTAKNYKEDGPDFKNSTTYLSELTIKISEKSNYIKELIKNRNRQITNLEVDEKHKKIYSDFMKDDSAAIQNILNTINEINETSNNIIKNCNNIFYLLQTNKNDWLIKEDKIAFSKQELLEQYYEYVNEINK